MFELFKRVWAERRDARKAAYKSLAEVLDRASAPRKGNPKLLRGLMQTLGLNDDDIQAMLAALARAKELRPLAARGAQHNKLVAELTAKVQAMEAKVVAAVRERGTAQDELKQAMWQAPAFENAAVELSRVERSHSELFGLPARGKSPLQVRAEESLAADGATSDPRLWAQRLSARMREIRRPELVEEGHDGDAVAAMLNAAASHGLFVPADVE